MTLGDLGGAVFGGVLNIGTGGAGSGAMVLVSSQTLASPVVPAISSLDHNSFYTDTRSIA